MPETREYGDKEVGQQHPTRDAKMIWPALTEQHRAEYTRPDTVTERRQQAADHRFHNRGSNIAMAEQEYREGIASTFQRCKSHTHCASQQQPIHLRSVTHPSRQKHHHQQLTPLL